MDLKRAREKKIIHLHEIFEIYSLEMWLMLTLFIFIEKEEKVN